MLRYQDGNPQNWRVFGPRGARGGGRGEMNKLMVELETGVSLVVAVESVDVDCDVEVAGFVGKDDG